MQCLDRFNKKMQLSGSNLRDEKIRNGRKLLEHTFEDDPSFMNCIYKWETNKLRPESYKNITPLKIRIYDRKFSSANGNTAKFQTLYDTKIDVGDVLYDSKHNEHYLCTESFDIDDINYEGKLTKCNWILKWQNEHGDILQYPCYIINATQYNSGEQFNKQFTIGSSQFIAFLPYDENTIVIRTPKRFFLDRDSENPTSYVVTQNDNVTYNYGDKGIVRLTLYEYEKDDDTDRYDIGICDYVDKKYKKSIEEKPCLDRAVIECDSSIIKSGGDMKTFTAKFFDKFDNEIKDVSPKWDIVCDFENILEVSKSDNSISIGIDDDDYVDEEFKLILSDESNTYKTDIIVKIESLL